MNKDLESFDYFVDDLLSSHDNLLISELDILLMQYLFNSIDLKTINYMGIQKDKIIAS